MTRSQTAALLLIAAVVVVCGAGSAQAEWNIDLYGGVAWIQSADLGVRGVGSDGTAANLTIFDVDTNTGFTFGLRGGYWIDPLPFLGFDLDVFYLQTPVPAQTTTGTGTLT